MAYGFRAMIPEDIPLVAIWLATPEVARWWEGAIDEDDLADPSCRQWIVSHQGRPFAYLQDYDPHAEADHPFAGLPPGSRGMDQFIGDSDMIGRGHGSAFLQIFADRLFGEGVPAVGVDPQPENLRAVRAYRKAGFQSGETRDTPWERCLLMTRHRT